MHDAKARILVIDSDSDARSTLSELLRDEGHEVHAVAEGILALGRASGWEPELVITDRMSSALRERVPEVAVIVTGSADTLAGADDFLSKPVQRSQLRSVLRRVLRVRRRSELEGRAPVIPGASMWEIERYAILRTLEYVAGSTSKAAKILGISPRKIQYRLHKYRANAEPVSLSTSSLSEGEGAS